MLIHAPSRLHTQTRGGRLRRSHVDAMKGDRQCFVRERTGLSLLGWQKVLRLADEASPWPCALNPHKHAFSASRDEEHRVKECGDEEGHEQAVRGGNREKTDAAERKKQKTKLNGEHLVFLSITTAVLSSPEVGVFSYCYYFYLGKLLINNLS